MRRGGPIVLGLRVRTWVLLGLAWFILYLEATRAEQGLSFAGYALLVGSVAALPMMFGPPRRAAAWLLRQGTRRARSGGRSRRPLRTDLLSILTLSPYGFEGFCRQLLEREGFRAVTTKQTGDQGVDVELRARDGRIGVAQCKQVLNGKIGRPIVQQLYGEMISRGATFAYLMTTGTFTGEAAAWARSKTITLVDREALLTMADRHRRGK